jgi:hypothetical protein
MRAPLVLRDQARFEHGSFISGAALASIARRRSALPHNTSMEPLIPMSTPINFALCLAATLACCLPSAAQRRRAAPPRAPVATAARPSPKPTWTILSQTDNEPASPNPFGLNYTYEGGDPARVKNIVLNFFSRSATCALPAKPALTLNLDGRALELPYQPDAKGEDGVFWAASDSEGGTCSESVGAFISPATLSRLAAANALSGKLGAGSFRLSSDNLAALRDLVSRVTPKRPPARTPLRARS